MIDERRSGCYVCGMLGPFGVILLLLVTIVLVGVKIIREYERAVILRLGRLVAVRGPGLIYVIPGIESMYKVDLRTITMDVPPQDVITRDNVSVTVSAVIYFRVVGPAKAIIEVQNFTYAT